MKRMSIIKLRKVWYAFSGIVVGGSILAVAVFGLKFGIDFTGGSFLSARFEKAPAPLEVEQSLASLNLGSMTVQPVGEKDINVRLAALDEDSHQAVLKLCENASET